MSINVVLINAAIFAFGEFKNGEEFLDFSNQRKD